MSTLLLTSILYNVWIACSDELCDHAYECVGRSLNDPGWTSFAGYKSGFGPTTSWNGESTNCRAAFSCTSMAFLTSISDKSGSIDCDGVFSCANTTITVRDLTCPGANSCTFSNLSLINLPILCEGHQSCAHAFIEKTDSIFGDAAYSLYNATIDTQGLASSFDLNIDLWSDYAAYGATLICRSGYTCNINCYAYNACYMFYVHCLGTCNFETQFRGKDTIAPITNITQLDPSSPIPALHDSLSLITRNEHLCNTHATSITRDDRTDTDVTNNPSLVFTTDGPICCRGRTSCRGTIVGHNYATGQYVICSAHRACSDSIISTHDGYFFSLFCGARMACYNAEISNAEIVYCWGEWSCQLTDMSKISTIVCSGPGSCYQAIIRSDGIDLNVFFSAYDSASLADIYCNVGDVCTIVCSGYDSCVDTIVYCDGICEVQCDELSDCPQVITLNPTTYPSSSPTYPSSNPTFDPSSVPTQFPSSIPTELSQYPSSNPTLYPSSHPSQHPSSYSTNHPSLIPTAITETPSNPSHNPSFNPVQHLSTQYPSLNPTERPIMTTTYDRQTSADADGATTTGLQRNRSNDPDMSADSLVFVLLIIIGIVVCIIGIVLVYVLYYFHRKTKMDKDIVEEKEIVGSQSNIVESLEWNQSTFVQTPTQCKEDTLGQDVELEIATIGRGHPGENQNGEGKNMGDHEVTIEGEENKNSTAQVTIGNNMEEDNIAPDEFIVGGDNDMICTPII
eukprot:392565_1